MLQIGEALCSLDIFEKMFCCNLAVCKGCCCEEGDSGAPLEDEETDILEDIYSQVEPFMTSEGVNAVKEHGAHTVDIEHDKVTPLINGKECAYSIIENGIYMCAIEKAYNAGKVNFRKPISCYLYPIRITKYPTYEALNYDKWDICKPARELGYKEGLRIYKFLKQPLIDKYGQEWYDELEIAADALFEQGMIK